MLFGASAGQGDDDIFSRLRNSSLQKDENAPLYPTKLKVARRAMADDATTVNKRTVVRLTAALSNRRKILWNQAVLRNRKNYFDEVDRRRVQRSPAHDLVESYSSTDPCKSRYLNSYPASLCIGQFLENIELGRKERPQILSRLLLSFLRGNFGLVEQEVAALLPVSLPPSPAADSSLASSTCLLCDLSFAKRGNLTMFVGVSGRFWEKYGGWGALSSKYGVPHQFISRRTLLVACMNHRKRVSLVSKGRKRCASS